MVSKASQNQDTFIRQILSSVLLGLLWAYVCAFLILPIESWMHNGLNMDTFSQALYFWKKAASFCKTIVVPWRPFCAYIDPRYILFAYTRWWHLFTNTSPIPLSFYLPFLPLCVFFAVLIFKIKQLKSMTDIKNTENSRCSKIKQKNKKKHNNTVAVTNVKKVKRKHKKIREK